MASRSPASAVTAPDCLERLRSAFAECDAVAARLAAAEADGSFQGALAGKARTAAEAAAAGIALGRITNAEGDALDAAAGAATKATRHAERLVTGLRKVLADAEAAVAGMAEAADAELREWALQQMLGRLPAYQAGMAAAFRALREATAVADAGGLGRGYLHRIKVPASFYITADESLEVGFGSDPTAPIASEASQIAAEAAALVTRARRLAEAAEKVGVPAGETPRLALRIASGG
jgi:hypothetical protein